MPRADEPRIMVRLSSELHEQLEGWAAKHGVYKPDVMREALELVGERAAVVAAAKKAAKREASGRAVKVRAAAPSRSRPGGAASPSPAPPASIPTRDGLEAAPAVAGEDRADAFRAIEERRRALRG